MQYLLYESPTVRNIVFLVGVLYLLRLMVWLLLSLWSGTKAFFLAGLFRVVDLKSYGWAVVTGASDGIGKEYAIQLAKHGVNVVLVARSVEKLRSVKKEILDLYNVAVRIVIADFSRTDIYDGISSQLSGTEIGILINNVGVTYDMPDYFLNVPEEKLWQLINVNMTSTVMMTKIVMPGMVEKKKGIVVNMSSAGALSPSPLMNVYSASKIFMDYFSSALHYEYSDKGIIVQSVLPSFVATKMTGITQPSFTAPSAQKYVHDALATIGVQNRTSGTLSHALQAIPALLLPESVALKATFGMLSDARKMMIARKQNKQ
ncbi:very-long-chain 3-oxoacyl-CoA reductase-like [Dysidea avara]|uniref:very-long-chain 3-oxoacyl-CoA reductase-like n=1 Tax=Dysidea avara TaxID=196820 RepID=UPI0033284EF0